MKTKFLPFLLAGIFICFTTFSNAQLIDSLGTLPLNTLKSDNLNGQTDVWKLITHDDGDIKITISQYSKNINYQLYDRDGVTALAVGNPHTDYSATTIITGLAAGTYYIHVYCDLNQSSLYGIKATLAQPATANDAEPNNTPVQALTLQYNGNAKGHLGYYYNNYRDTADWYKVTTKEDGELRLTVKKGDNNDNNIVYTLYDHDASTVLFSTNTGYTGSNPYDGLAAGTYYVKVNMGDSRVYNTYTLSDSLFTYNPVDPVPGKYFKQAATLLSGKTATGHVGFYYNNARDTMNTYKLNYTGTNGKLTLTLHLLPNIQNGQYQGVFLQIYKDTTADPIYNNGSSSDQLVNLTSLAKGYYYIKVRCYYPQYFMAYSLSNSFTQANKAHIEFINADTAANCSSTNSLSFKCTLSHAPYTVNLYRFGTLYTTKTVASQAAFSINNLPDGLYNATAFGDGATGSAFGKSDTIAVMPEPSGLTTTTIQQTAATLKWTVLSCADYYTIQYRKTGTGTWKEADTTGTVGSYKLKALKAATQYEWRMRAVDSENNMLAISAYTNTVTFTTKSGSGFADVQSDEEDNVSIENNKTVNSSLIISPNPATSYFVIRYNNNTQQKANAILYDANGKAIWVSGLINANTLNGKQINISQFESGLYYLKIINDKSVTLGVAKVSITK